MNDKSTTHNMGGANKKKENHTHNIITQPSPPDMYAITGTRNLTIHYPFGKY